LLFPQDARTDSGALLSFYFREYTAYKTVLGMFVDSKSTDVVLNRALYENLGDEIVEMLKNNSAAL